MSSRDDAGSPNRREEGSSAGCLALQSGEEVTDVDEFRKFHALLTEGREGYTPWYFRLSKDDKDPLKRILWKETKGRISFEKACEYMANRGNVGIAATNMDPLCIVDIDDIKDSAMQPTLSARSRKRIGRHYFYFTDDPKCKENLPTEKCGEIRANWQYVVAPGSFVLCSDEEVSRMPKDQRQFAGRYSIENPVNPTQITWEAMPQVFQEQARKNDVAIREKRKTDKKKKAEKKEKKESGDRKNKSALFDISCEDIFNIPTKERFTSLFHDSETGKNTSYDGNLITCWRHNCTHTPLSGLAVLAGIADCMDAGKGMKGSGVGDSNVDYSDGHTIYKIWKFAKREGMIPNDDPIPPAALRWYAVDSKLCEEGEIIDGWKLPPGIYGDTIRQFEREEGISAGRDVKSTDTPPPAPPPPPPPQPAQGVPGQYEVVNYELFRKLSARYPDSTADAIDATGVATVYSIVGDDFIEEALDLEAIVAYTSDEGNATLITAPEQLHAFIGNVEARLDGENTVYYVTVRSQKIEFRAEEITDITMWRRKALYTCKLVISFDLRKNAVRDTFNLMIVDIIDRAEVVWEEKYSIDDVYAQMIMTEVDKLIEVDARASFARNPAAILSDGGVRYVKSSTIAGIHERLRIPHGLEKIRIILSPYLAESSKRLTIDNKRYSCWVFKGEVQ